MIKIIPSLEEYGCSTLAGRNTRKKNPIAEATIKAIGLT
jgi:hypothetical protein